MLAACGPGPRPTAPAAVDDRAAIVAAEKGPRGARLVAIDEHGDRRHVVVAESDAVARDTNPAVSPDGAWVVFASSRGRPLAETSLWIARLGVEQAPARLTEGPWIDAHPAWAPDGTAIVFASTREGGDFDLWRLPIANGRAAGAPEQLTHGDGHEVTPSVAADGTIVFSEVTPIGGGQIESRISARAPDGTETPVTPGPADATPALSPDGAWIAFSRAEPHDGRPNTELWLRDRATGTEARVVDLPITDESGPVWSPDGAWLFATSVIRGESSVVFSSVIAIELSAKVRVARMLEDRAGGIPRLTPAIVSRTLDAAALRADPEYLPELARIMAHTLDQATDPATTGSAP